MALTPRENLFPKENPSISLRYQGLTLIELLLTITILVLVSGLVFPSFSETIDRIRLKSTAHDVYSHLQLARHEALRTGSPVSISFKEDSGTWCYGFSDTPIVTECDCLSPSSCQIENQERAYRYDSENNIALAQARFAGTEDILVFSPEHGLAVGGGSVRSGSIWLRSRQGKMTAVVVSRLGRIRICSAGDSGCPTPPQG